MDIKMEREKNMFVIMLFMKENIQGMKEMEKEKNMIMMVI